MRQSFMAFYLIELLSYICIMAPSFSLSNDGGNRAAATSISFHNPRHRRLRLTDWFVSRLD